MTPLKQQPIDDRTKAVHVKLKPQAYDQLSAVAKVNGRGRGPEIAIRIEAELAKEAEGK